MVLLCGYYINKFSTSELGLARDYSRYIFFCRNANIEPQPIAEVRRTATVPELARGYPGLSLGLILAHWWFFSVVKKYHIDDFINVMIKSTYYIIKNYYDTGVIFTWI